MQIRLKDPARYVRSQSAVFVQPTSFTCLKLHHNAPYLEDLMLFLKPQSQSRSVIHFLLQDDQSSCRSPYALKPQNLTWMFLWHAEYLYHSATKWLPASWPGQPEQPWPQALDLPQAEPPALISPQHHQLNLPAAKLHSEIAQVL